MKPVRPYFGIFALLLPLATGNSSAAPANQLADKEADQGWKLLFDGKTTSGWHVFRSRAFPSNSWTVAEGWLHCSGHGGADIVSEELFEEFELTWDWKIAAGANSGVKYFVVDSRSAALGHEYQLIDDEHNPDGKTSEGKHGTASFYDVLKPTAKPPLRAPGQVNHSQIVVSGMRVEHWLNGEKVLQYDCGSEATLAAVEDSKFRTTPGFGKRQKGRILLQEHGGDVWFQNIKIRSLSDN